MGFFHRRLVRQCRSFCSSSTTTINAAKSSLRGEQDPDRALAIFNSLPDDLPAVSTRFALDITVKRLAKSRRFADIESLIESLKKSPKISQEHHVGSLIRAYGRAGMLDHAVRTFEQMDALGTPRSVLSFNALLSAGNISRKFDQVSQLFTELATKYGIRPDSISYGILIKSLCESGSPESGWPVLKEMREKEVEITAFTYTSLLDAFYEKGEVQEAEKIWNEMRKRRCKPDVTAHNVKVKNAAGGKPGDVLKVIDEMRSAGLKPDTISYNYLMTAYCKNNQMENAMKVYQSLPLNGCNANAATYRVLVFHLCKKREFDQGLEVFRSSVKVDKIPDFATLKLLVEGLAENSKMEEANEVITVVKKRFPESFLKAWKKVEAKLGLGVGKDPAPVAV